MSLTRRLWNSYLQVLERRPLRTQMIQTFTTLSTGDVIAQKFIEGRTDIEAKRVLRFGAIGCFLIAPVIRGWYLTLERVVTPYRVPNAFAATLAKVSLDQLAFAPIFNVVLISIIGLSQVSRIHGPCLPPFSASVLLSNPSCILHKKIGHTIL